MTKFIKKIVLFIAFISAIYPIAIFVYTYRPIPYTAFNVSNKMGAYGHMNSRIKEVKQTQDIDVLALGSSICYRGIDPRIFKDNGLDLFNLGSSGQTHIQSYVLLKQYLDRLSPKYVIYECSPEIMTIDGVGSAIDIISNSDINLDVLKMSLTVNHIKAYNTLFNMHLRSVFRLDDDFKEAPIKNEDTYVQGGFVEKKIKYFKKQSPKDIEPSRFDPLHYQFEAFKDNIQLIQESGAELFLVIAPKSNYKYLSSPCTASSDSLLSSFGNFTNFNTIMQMNDSLHFYDQTHLNQNGVKLFNDSLISMLFPEYWKFKNN